MNERRFDPLVFVSNIDSPVLDSQTHSHLSKSLRLPAGAGFNITNGAGQWRSATLTETGLEVASQVHLEAQPQNPKAVAFAPVKGDRTTWVVQKLTELNIAEIILIETQRSVVRWDESRRAKQLAKLNRVALEACGQCRRVWLPTISFSTLGDVLALSAAVMADPDGRPVTSSDRVIVVGPEGGWDPKEAALADHVVLPGAVLRAETAAIAAAVTLSSFA